MIFWATDFVTDVADARILVVPQLNQATDFVTDVADARILVGPQLNHPLHPLCHPLLTLRMT